jgi:hypothetical protein
MTNFYMEKHPLIGISYLTHRYIFCKNFFLSLSLLNYKEKNELFHLVIILNIASGMPPGPGCADDGRNVSLSLVS